MNQLLNFRNLLFTGWHFMRWLRLGLALFVGIQAIQLRDTAAGFIAAFFLFQAITNTGCCGGNSCTVPTIAQKSNTIEEVEFEEINANLK
ncbi:MAG: hypothetical protein AABY93_09550 [Bacteroidota bacterium]